MITTTTMTMVAPCAASEAAVRGAARGPAPAVGGERAAPQARLPRRGSQAWAARVDQHHQDGGALREGPAVLHLGVLVRCDGAHARGGRGAAREGAQGLGGRVALQAGGGQAQLRRVRARSRSLGPRCPPRATLQRSSGRPPHGLSYAGGVLIACGRRPRVWFQLFPGDDAEASASTGAQRKHAEDKAQPSSVLHSGQVRQEGLLCCEAGALHLVCLAPLVCCAAMPSWCA
jgi:hypothetical protein